MDADGAPQSGATGSGASSAAGSGSNTGSGGNQVTTTSTQQQQVTSKSCLQGQSTTSPTSTPTGISSRPGTNKAAIACGVIGGAAGLFLIAFFGWFVLKRRRDKKRNAAEPVTYANVNNSMAGVPFSHWTHAGEQQSLVVPQSASTRDGVEMHGGYSPNEAEDNRLYFLPTYAESQAGMSQGPTPGGTSQTSYPGYESESTVHSAVSPVTPTDAISRQTMGNGAFLRPQYTPDTMGFPVDAISPQTTGGAAPFMRPQRTTDTMGFPIDDPGIGFLRSTTPASIVAPIPRPLLVHQDSLERVVRESMMNGTFEQQDTGLRINEPLGIVSSRYSHRTESPTLGVLPLRSHVAPASSNLNGGVRRSENQSTRTTSVISVISDTELDRLGVDARSRWL